MNIWDGDEPNPRRPSLWQRYRTWIRKARSDAEIKALYWRALFVLLAAGALSAAWTLGALFG